MKAPACSVFIRVVLVGAALGAAFLIGWMYWHSQQTPLPNGRGLKISSADAGTIKTPKLSRDQAWEQWQTALADPRHAMNADFLGGIMEKINPSDISFIINKLHDLPPGGDRDFAISFLFPALIGHDPSAALSLTEDIADPEERANLTGKIFAQMMETDPDAAMAALAQFPSSPQMQTAYREAFLRWALNPAQDSIAAAAAFALPAGSERAAALLGVVRGWTDQDPAAAINWAARLPSEDSAALQEALIDIASQKPTLAAQYIDGLPDGSARNQVIQSIAASLAQEDPVAAFW